MENTIRKSNCSHISSTAIQPKLSRYEYIIIYKLELPGNKNINGWEKAEKGCKKAWKKAGKKFGKQPEKT